jgi:hypothetical protein
MEKYRIIVDISNHPTLGLQRKVGFKRMLYNYEERSIKLYTDCLFFQNDEPYSDRTIKPFERILFADEATKCNPANGLVCTLIDNVWIDKADVTVASPISLFDFFDGVFTGVNTNGVVDVLGTVTNIIETEDDVYNGFD